MENNSYTATIEVEQPPEMVFSCINDVPKWWTTDFEGNNAKPGDEFVICHPGAHYAKHKLIEAMPGKKIVWLVTESTLSWLENNKQEWTNTSMIFEITAKDDKTLLQFTHDGLTPAKECYERCSQGWSMVIKERLFGYITEGKVI
jgi:uncharacterized protein YndB with AHSA1/START domain